MVEIVRALVTFFFRYCTDFVINLANLTGLSYYEINTLLFVIVWPLLTMLLIAIFVLQKLRWTLAKHRVARRPLKGQLVKK